MKLYYIILFIHFVLSLLMTGLIWTIQIVHYPSFLFIKKDNFKPFHDFHCFKISLLVIPLMVFELLTALLLVIYKIKLEEMSQSSITLIDHQVYSILMINSFLWAITFFISAKKHQFLQRKQNDVKIKELIQTNWIRTIGWTLKSIIVSIMIFSSLIGCDQKVTPKDCQDLAFKSFRGVPNAAHDYKENCQNVNVKYDEKVCQKAFTVLVLGSSKESLESKFGDQVLSCFTKEQLKNHLK